MVFALLFMPLSEKALAIKSIEFKFSLELLVVFLAFMSIKISFISKSLIFLSEVFFGLVFFWLIKKSKVSLGHMSSEF